MFLTLLNIVLPVVGLTAVGFTMGRRQKTAPEMGFINRANVMVFCPSLVFSALMAHPVSVVEGWPLLIAGTLVVVLPGLVLYGLRPAGISRPAFLLAGMFRNTGNVGIPLMVLAYGNQLLGDIVILFVLSNLLHFRWACFYCHAGATRGAGLVTPTSGPPCWGWRAHPTRTGFRTLY